MLYKVEDLLSKRQDKNLLYDFYGALLTEKQQEIFTMINQDDCSFAEVGRELDITPQAVADVLKRATTQLEKFEDNLGMVAKFMLQKKVFEDVEICLNELDELELSDISATVNSIKSSLSKLLV